MLWLLFLPLPCLGGSVPPTPGPSPGHELVGIIGGCDVSQEVPVAVSLPSPYHLQEVEVPIVGHKVCNKHYQTFEDGNNPIKDDMLCAGSKGRDSCQYDSGGPQVCSWNCAWVQVGVVSWGYKCGLHNFPGVYTQAMSYVPWIRQYVPLSPRA
ncbi:hypothetical protein CB1_000144003 [Camelus ferus]|nr:hypothetical protein CB1_000144003 [Camelus ferus]